MIRNLKVLGLALVALLAMSAMVASAASAAEKFTASSGKGTKISAEDTGNIKFTVTNSTVTCTKAVFTGTAPGESFTEVSVNAEYSGCTGFGFPATVKGFGQHGEASPCTFNLEAGGNADLNCPAGQDVTVEAGPCTVHVPAQQNLGTLTYENRESHVGIYLNVTKIKGTHTDGFLCPFGGSGENSEGVLETPADQTVTGPPHETKKFPITVIASKGTISVD